MLYATAANREGRQKEETDRQTDRQTDGWTDLAQGIKAGSNGEPCD